MKYPRISDSQDLRRKLLDKDIVALKAAYTLGYPFQGSSYRKWVIAKAFELGVSPSTVYYHTDASYQAKMKAKNAKAHSKADMADYVAHRAAEIKRRVGRWDRNPALREWHYQVSAKAKKRGKRKTVMGKPIE